MDRTNKTDTDYCGRYYGQIRQTDIAKKQQVLRY